MRICFYIFYFLLFFRGKTECFIGSAYILLYQPLQFVVGSVTAWRKKYFAIFQWINVFPEKNKCSQSSGLRATEDLKKGFTAAKQLGKKGWKWICSQIVLSLHYFTCPIAKMLVHTFICIRRKCFSEHIETMKSNSRSLFVAFKKIAKQFLK